jgi:SMP-30/gluconolaconase/LRE-like protein
MSGRVDDEDDARDARVSPWTGDDSGPGAQQTVLKRQRVRRILLVGREILPLAFPISFPNHYIASTVGRIVSRRSQYGDAITQANGTILSPDEKMLYVTNGAVVLAFDVKADGSLTNQRQFGKLRGGQAGDGSAVDIQGRLYVATGASVDVFSPKGEFLGSIVGPQGRHGTAFGGRDKKTLFGIVFHGSWGTASARNRVIAIPTIAQGYTGRAK